MNQSQANKVNQELGSISVALQEPHGTRYQTPIQSSRATSSDQGNHYVNQSQYHQVEQQPSYAPKMSYAQQPVYSPQVGYVAPQQQGYAAPQQPGYAAPHQQGYAAPQQQGYAAPQQQGYAAPQQQGYAAPQQQGYAAPQQPGYAAPYAAQQQPGYSPHAAPQQQPVRSQPANVHQQQNVANQQTQQNQLEEFFYKVAGIDRAIDFQEFVQVILLFNSNLRNHPKFVDVTQSLFGLMDANRNGYITLNEFVAGFPTLRQNLGV